MKINIFSSSDFFMSLSATQGVCNAKEWLDYYASLDEYRKFDIDRFFYYLSLGVKMQYAHQPFKLNKNNQQARSIIVLTPNNAELKLTIQEFPGFELFEQRLLLCKVNINVTELNKLATEIISKQSDPDQVTSIN